MKRPLAALLLLWLTTSLTGLAQCWQWVDVRIGSVGVGRTFPGPAMPFGMVKPGPDCGVLPNAGWAPMPEPVLGFSQTHVSGTGGGQKYGNILLQPLLSMATDSHGLVRTFMGYPQRRTEERIELGYYATTYENGIRTEVTTSERCAYYRFHYPPEVRTSPCESVANESPCKSVASLFIDATHFLGKDSIPDLRERQQFVGAEVQVVSSHEVQGYSSVRGGWNNGDAYTVFFCLQTDKPFTVQDVSSATFLYFADTLVNVKVGISYVSTGQARSNIGTATFSEQLSQLRQAWEEQLAKVAVVGTDQQRRMFYTALYHTMLMPVDKTGENPRWTDAPYYDDYYAIWDTYRTSSPLLTLLCPEREVELVNSLLNIYRHEGYLPDARSGDCNGRTQGGSNAEVVIADAWAKGLGRHVCCDAIAAIDYELALEAMLKDAEADPGSDHEKHGRGGLTEYKRLGYIPYGIPRAGTRTVEYAFCDWCLAQVAKGLGRQAIHDKYLRRSANWRNLWRSDYEWDDVKGYIMPRDADGHWLDTVPWGRSKVFKPQIPYTPVTKVAPWHLPWWDTFFYEALSAEYSLSIPHDVPGLIEACGGPETFRRRLDLFFERGRYNVGNEPSFLTPCLYHWLGRPDLSTQRIHQIIRDNYSDQPDGLPGNDDSGAMSSWLAFHMLGLYPLAGTDVYLLNVPLLREYTFTLPNGKALHVSAQGEGSNFKAVAFNGQELKEARITHQQLMEGGRLEYSLSPSLSPKEMGATADAAPITSTESIHSPLFGREAGGEAVKVFFTLNRQFRTWPVSFDWQGDTLQVQCNQTLYRIARHEAEHATGFCWQHPQTDGTVYHGVKGTFLFVSADAMRQLRERGSFIYDGITWRQIAHTASGRYHVQADIDGTEMFIQYQKSTGLYLVTEMRSNPLGIDWIFISQRSLCRYTETSVDTSLDNAP